MSLQNIAKIEDYNKKIIPPQSWKKPREHFNAALDHPWYKLLFDLQSSIVFFTYDFFRMKNMAAVLNPITCNSVTSPMGLGSDSLPVSIHLFGEKTFLADSMQFHLEYILRQGKKSGVFYIMPTFRGEDPDERHLNQFYHIEAEIIGGLEKVINLLNEYLIYVIGHIYKQHRTDISRVVGTTQHLSHFLQRGIDIPRLRFSEAIKLLGNDPSNYTYFENKIIGLSNQGENRLIKVREDGLWLTHLPRMGVPFYQADAPDDQYASLAADLLIGIGEVIGSGQRHETYSSLLNGIRYRGVDASEYEWYLRLKKEYPSLTSGFGIGLERMLLWITKHNDIRDIPLISRLKNIESTP